MNSLQSNCRHINGSIYECKKCGVRFTVVEMPCGVSGPGCKDREEVYCPHCHTLMFTRMIPGTFQVSKHN